LSEFETLFLLKDLYRFIIGTREFDENSLVDFLKRFFLDVDIFLMGYCSIFV